MFHRATTLLVILALLIFGSATLAQEPTTFCGDLSEADCQLLTQADAAMGEIDSGTVNFSLDVNLLNISDSPDEPANISISVTGNGSASGLGDFSAMSTSMASETDLSVVLPELLNALETFNGDLSLNILIPEELAEGGPNSLDINLVWVDGTGYIDLDALQPVLNDPSLSGWGGLEIVALVREALEQQPELLDQLSEMSAMSGAGMAESGIDPAMIERFNDPEFAAQYLTVQRVADEGGLAVFETTLDFGALYNDPAFQKMIQQQMQSQMSGDDVSDEEMQQAMEMGQQMLEDATFAIRQVIDPASGTTSSISASMTLDMTSVMEAAGESMANGAPVFNFDFIMDFSNYNSAPAATAPEGANLFPYEMLLGMMSNPQ